MTREQAKIEIDSLDYYLQNHTDDYGEESHTAMMMAIKALEAKDNEKLLKVRDAINEYGSIMVEYSTNPIWSVIVKELDGKIGQRAIGRLWKNIDRQVEKIVTDVTSQAKEAVIDIINEHIGEEQK